MFTSVSLMSLLRSLVLDLDLELDLELGFRIGFGIGNWFWSMSAIEYCHCLGWLGLWFLELCLLLV
ncbi:hypothetical protein BSPWISOXPB_7379 [uncultured Gammaproteobacteria bacterium]|nr:hypothetical protein BSPWISOXPB_7379 [uncultured Gammaproteobacteria bacterium]